ncbi:MAG: pre-peptidase C-terminal domain-containing protein, partial [Rudaea sp.]
GHEWHEMVSDQFPAGGWTATSGYENSDECAWIAAGQAGGAANVVMGTGTFTEQASWSNDTNACAISHSIVNHGSGGGGGTPSANFSFVTNGLAATFTDSSTDSGGTIGSHSWTFGDGGTSTATNPSHTYASANTYSVTETVTDSVNSSTSSKTESVTVTSGGGSVLQNGVGVSISDSTVNDQKNFTMSVPAGATNLVFSISGGTGDADLYVKFGSAPTLSSYDCRPYITGNNESCPISNVQAGTYYVMVNTYAAYSGVTLVGSYTAPGAGGTPTANFTFTTSGLTASFTDSSTDAGGTIGSHSWNFGDGGTSTTTNPSHTYAAAGTYSVSETVTDSVNGSTSSKTASVTVSSGGGGGCGGTVLCSGVPVTGLAATRHNWSATYTMVVPAGQSSVVFQIAGSTGDADLYVKIGSAPTTSSYNCRPYLTGDNETCTFNSPTVGTYYVKVRAYATYSGVSLTGTITP